MAEEEGPPLNLPPRRGRMGKKSKGSKGSKRSKSRKVEKSKSSHNTLTLVTSSTQGTYNRSERKAFRSPSDSTERRIVSRGGEGRRDEAMPAYRQVGSDDEMKPRLRTRLRRVKDNAMPACRQAGGDEEMRKNG